MAPFGFTLTGATGTELRFQNYDSQPGSPGTAYAFDPQGSLAQPITLYLPGQPPFAKVRSSSAYDAFGWNSTFTADAADTYDPVGFGGQFGYYKDGATGLYLLTHRYYDAGAGRFLTRDPIGYGGGMNLYGFAGNNPVNESDPSGYNPLSRYLGRKLSAFERAAQKAGQTAMEFLEEGAEAKAEYSGLTPTVPEPPLATQSPNARASAEIEAEVRRTQKLPIGGTYILRDPVNGRVMRTGMATNLIKRKSDHKSDYPGLVFEVDKRSSSKDARRGREQIIHDLHNPPYDKQNPIKEKNYTPEEYKRMMDAGRKL